MSVLERCPSYRESNKGSKERQGPTLGVRTRLIEVSVKRESTVVCMITLHKVRLFVLGQLGTNWPGVITNIF